MLNNHRKSFLFFRCSCVTKKIYIFQFRRYPIIYSFIHGIQVCERARFLFFLFSFVRSASQHHSRSIRPSRLAPHASHIRCPIARWLGVCVSVCCATCAVLPMRMQRSEKESNGLNMRREWWKGRFRCVAIGTLVCMHHRRRFDCQQIIIIDEWCACSFAYGLYKSNGKSAWYRQYGNDSDIVSARLDGGAPTRTRFFLWPPTNFFRPVFTFHTLTFFE